ncbi:MAG TPA: trypsin-like peptidase domain-containing protein [Acidimicrobiia bacterium]|nr:trypsin-like peptidase domain-containing protein [Acidimicrobiia bacterium]
MSTDGPELPPPPDPWQPPLPVPGSHPDPGAGESGAGAAGAADPGAAWPPPPPTTESPLATDPPPAAGPPSPRGRGRRAAVGVAVLALVAASGGVGAAVGVHVGESHHPSTVTIGAASSPQVSNQPAAATSGTVGAAAARVIPSVVTINETGQSGGGTGSGVIITADGDVLTNNHVVSDAANGGTLEVVLSNGKKYGASIVGRDPLSDLAVIKIQGAGTLTPAVLGDSESLHVGDEVVAVGSPLGLSGTVTSGIVSALHRAVATGDPSVSDTNAVIDAIQTDAAINPGNSGGPLVNLQGQVVGINSAIASVGSGSGAFPGQQSQQSGNIGVGFAIPIDAARDVATQLIQSGHATHAYLGVQATTSADDRSGASGETADSGNGALVRSVESGSPAAAAGVQAGDVITQVGSRQVTGVETLVAAVQSHHVGDKVPLTYQRNGSTTTVTVTLAAAPASQ